MSSKRVLKKFRAIWSPKAKDSVGSLYDVVAEEEQRIRERTQTRQDLLESIAPRNSAYDTHAIVVRTFNACMIAANDFLYLMKESQKSLYRCMSTWVGRSEDPRIEPQIFFLKDLTISETLNDFPEILKYLLQNCSSGNGKLVSVQFVSVYEDLCKLSRKMDRIATKMSSHICDMTPLMLKYSEKSFPSKSSMEMKSTAQLTNKASVLTYGREYEKIITERSASVIALTSSSALSATMFRPRFLFRIWYSIGKLFFCFKKNKTKVIRAPSIVNASARTVKGGKGTPSSLELSPSNDAIQPSTSESPSKLGMKEDEQPKFLEFEFLHEFKGAMQSESSIFDFTEIGRVNDASIAQRKPVLRPQHPVAHVLSRLTELKAIISTVSERIRELESQFYELPYDKLMSDPKACCQFSDIVQTIKEQSTVLESVIDYDVYIEEEIMVTTALRNVYLEGLKTGELYRQFAEMVSADRDLLSEILHDTGMDNLAQSRPIVPIENDLVIEVKPCTHLNVGFKGIKLRHND